MTTFAEAARKESAWKLTENGQPALNTTFNACLDLFATIGGMRTRTAPEICAKFAEAYKEYPLLATKIVFYARDIRGVGLGERRTPRILFEYMAKYHPEALRPNIWLIPEYGRWDDVYALVGTPLESQMWAEMATQYRQDLKAMEKGEPVSLLAKWIYTPARRNKEKAEIGKICCKEWDISETELNQNISKLRSYLKIVEKQMSRNEWGEIDYSAVPSRASMIYRNAFVRHDKDRYEDYIDRAVNGEAKINSSALFPYDIVEKVWKNGSYWLGKRKFFEDKTLEAQWRQLPNYVEPGTNAMVVADTSGSMDGRPMYSALGLAIYFAERNTGAFHNLWMSFSNSSNIHELKGETLAQKLSSIDMNDWSGSTNCEAAFDKILQIGIRNHVAPEDMPKSIIIISDMEFDSCNCDNSTKSDLYYFYGGNSRWTFYDEMKRKYAAAGYEICNIVFWNVNARHDTFHTDAEHEGVQLVSGQSTATFKNLVGSIGKTPVELMLDVINSERYAPIKIG